MTLLSGLRIWHCRELWCRLQTRLRSFLTMAVVRSAAAALISPLAWEFPYAGSAALKSKKKKRKKKEHPLKKKKKEKENQ